MKIEIYSKDQCPFCDMAIHKAQAMIQERSDISYKVYNFGVDFGREQMMEKFPTARTFPQIVVNDENIGGWKEFQEIA